MSEGLLTSLLEKVDTLSNTFVFQGYQALVSHLTPTIFALIALSMVIFGYALIQGVVSFSIRDLSQKVLITGFVLAFALNWGIFSKYVYVLFTQVPEELSRTVLSAISTTSPESMTQALQQSFYQGFDLVKATWEMGGLKNPMPFMWAMVMALLLLLFVGIALIELIVAKFGLAIYLVLAPIIIPLFLFQKTKALVFEGWLKQLVMFAFIPLFITVNLSLALLLFEQMHLDTQSALSQGQITLTQVIPYLLYLIVCIGLIKKAHLMAASLTHAFSIGASPYIENTAQSMHHHVMKTTQSMHHQIMKTGQWMHHQIMKTVQRKSR